MSSGFAGSLTRHMGKFEREVESRLDIFTDDFQPPGAFEKVPGSDVNKPKGGYEKPHDDTVPEADKRFVRMAAAGLPKDQEPMDALDRIEQRYQARIKEPGDQFPVGKESPSSLNAKKKDADAKAKSKGSKIDEAT